MSLTNSLSSSFRCELRVIGAKNVETEQEGSFFVRCYLTAGNNRRIQLDTKEITMSPEKSAYLSWNESFSLVCNSAENPMGKLREESIVFELRCRPKSKPITFLAKAIGGSHSHLLASTEVAWKNVLDAPSTEVQTWVLSLSHVKPWALEIAIKVEDLGSVVSMEETRRRRRRRGDSCGCSSNVGGEWCCSCVDNELLFVTEALEGGL